MTLLNLREREKGERDGSCAREKGGEREGSERERRERERDEIRCSSGVKMKV